MPRKNHTKHPKNRATNNRFLYGGQSRSPADEPNHPFQGLSKPATDYGHQYDNPYDQAPTASIRVTN